MAYRRLSSGRPALPPRRDPSSRRVRAAALAALVGTAALVAVPNGLPPSPGGPDVTAPRPSASHAASHAAATPPPDLVRRLLDPTLARGAETFTFGSAAPLGSMPGSVFARLDSRSDASKPDASKPDVPKPDVTDAAPDEAARMTPQGPIEAMQFAQVTPPAIPLPAPRPPDLRAAEPASPPRPVATPMSRRMRVAARPPTVEDNRSFFEKLFGIQATPSTPGPALAYAALGTGRLETAPRPRLSPSPVQPVGAGTAIYDISARTVTLPNGERLEAHSGLGDKIDDPRHVHVRMRGATPPGTYDLTEREQLFHGVRAIRLNPVGGSAVIFGRTGLLAHTFMLGPNGDSNGCVSFRDYGRFLQAFVRGEVTRLVVVAGRGRDAWPNFASTGGSQPAPSDRSARGV